ncbi:sister chromatid separation protein [Colletotrichum kahawae]|uniref:Sister chromatid separation protein n=1 Tax=Colletotrichum kahawae TaxID=34407 RepID=A0AAD9YPG5_COLKA|nr:sister chromatid separation protein [Colletotrichum kahawae]
MTGTSPEPELSKISSENHETKTEISSGEVALDDPLTNIPTQSDDVSYLQAGFNPASITIAKLRNILSAHEVPYATAKTKNDFVLLFLTDIKPRAAATLMAMASVKRTDAGIIDMRR